jgi:hypothetical protein
MWYSDTAKFILGGHVSERSMCQLWQPLLQGQKLVAVLLASLPAGGSG